MIYERSLINPHECFCANSYLSAHSADVLCYSGVLLRVVCKLTCAGHMTEVRGELNVMSYILSMPRVGFFVRSGKVVGGGVIGWPYNTGVFLMRNTIIVFNSVI